ncbi:hypothetical protein [Paenibacillus urinalis]|uniref:hypothetical protein n=1 Tax=Paenibacillus urinalis TaxID=521520 RepID=UPI00196119B7
MTQASQKITQQFKDGGVIPGQLVGQSAVSKTYVDGQLSERDDRIFEAKQDADSARSEINELGTRVDNIVASAGDSNTEIVDARGGYPVLASRFNAMATEFTSNTIKAGGLGNGAGGIVLGAATNMGEDGAMLGMDGNPSWMTVMPTKKGSPIEISIQPSYDLGYVSTNGKNVTWLSGNKFDSEWSGANIYIDNTLFHVESYQSDTVLTLVEDAGVRNDVPYQKISTTATGFVNTNGTTVTWNRGNLFAYWWGGSPIIINGVTYTIERIESAYQLILTESAGVQNGVSFTYDQSANYDAASIGINKKSGDSEERIVLAAKAYGEYRLATVATGRGKHFPFYLDIGGANALKVNTDQSVEIHSSSNAVLGLFPSGGRVYYFVAKTNGEISLYCDSVGDVFVINGDTARMSFNKPPILPNHSKSNLPPQVSGGMIYVTDDTGGPVVAFSDGTNWRRVTDRAIIS